MIFLLPLFLRFFFFLIYRKNVPEYAVSREKNDLGALRFDLSTDLTPLFNWNTKQLFLYLTAEYQTQNNKVNQVRMWNLSLEFPYWGCQTQAYIQLISIPIVRQKQTNVHIYKKTTMVYTFIRYPYNVLCIVHGVQVVLWDKIIQRGEASVVKLKNQHLKYYFWDDGNGLL